MTVPIARPGLKTAILRSRIDVPAGKFLELAGFHRGRLDGGRDERKISRVFGYKKRLILGPAPA
ncbi:MAG: hypothetical protein A2Y69_07925 [Candidatus Aminicenantes bacterium RBG_13_59_9]|nr:MAG: hypothetical protein A2Y69_07925 [Candidatus Aminicenantes bacterium RBG_13_59_9]